MMPHAHDRFLCEGQHDMVMRESRITTLVVVLTVSRHQAGLERRLGLLVLPPLSSFLSITIALRAHEYRAGDSAVQISNCMHE
jgi:hypothetical protein